MAIGSDYAPMLLGQGKEQQLYFTTTRSAVLGNDVSGITAQKNGDVFFVQLDEKGVGNPRTSIVD